MENDRQRGLDPSEAANQGLLANVDGGPAADPPTYDQMTVNQFDSPNVDVSLVNPTYHVSLEQTVGQNKVTCFDKPQQPWLGRDKLVDWEELPVLRQALVLSDPASYHGI